VNRKDVFFRSPRLVSIAVLAFVALGAISAPVEAAVKGQYIAKMYTEGLGRIPDQGGWLYYIDLFATQGCNATTLRNLGVGVYTSSEFNNLGYDNPAKLLTLYRGTLNREPDATSFNSNLNLLNSGTSWSTMVNNFLNSSEFNNLVGSMCNSANYGFGSQIPIALPVSSGGFTGNQDQLQALINGTPSGGTVWLAQKTLIYLYKPLVLKAGVTLATTGNPDPRHYANMARLVRSIHFNDAMIRMLGGSKLKSVWVDGNRKFLGFSFNDVNIQIWGGTGTEVSNCRFGNPSGGTNLKALGSGEGYPCGGTTIRGNLIDAYTSSHYNSAWADGLTIVCENTLVENNEIVDATDVAIVVFGSMPVTQKTTVRYNRILNVGNSAYGGLVFDAWKDQNQDVYFDGAVIHDNTLWSGPSVHFDIGLSVGTRPWFGDASNRGYGAQMLNNTSGISKINVDTGIAVSGMFNAIVSGNTLDMTHLNVNTCPTVDVAAAISAGWASGSIQAPVTNTDVRSCVSH
jgi:hypothetical protein